MEFNKIQKIIYETAVSHGWHDIETNFPTFLMLTVSELSEALQEYRTYYGDQEIDQKIKQANIEIELADTVIRIMDYCEHNAIGLEGRILQKNEYNKTRPYRHGKLL